MKYQVSLLLVITLVGIKVNSQETILDFKLAPIFRRGRENLKRFIQPMTFSRGFQEIMKQNKVQRQFSSDMPFFCDVNGPGARSKTVPKSVHTLRFGDIDIVGAIGDSLTAGNGIFALNELQVLIEGRGASWSIGGYQTWRQFLTLPNIIKEFNPNLYGFSISGDANSYDKASRFNVAEVGAMATDTVHQARNIVKRMRSDPKVNIKNHWKLLTYMIGANDFCLDICYHQDQNKVIEKAAEAMILALRILRENLPRTLVNVVLPPDVSLLLRFTNKPDACKTLHYFECPCLFSLNHFRNRNRTFDTINRWKIRVEEIVAMPEFHDRSDFDVTLHPFLDKTDIPKDAQGITEYKYMSRDCFHLTQLGHARAANAYYNSMLVPESQRMRAWKKEFEEFRCPSQQYPFIFTSKNG